MIYIVHYTIIHNVQLYTLNNNTLYCSGVALAEVLQNLQMKDKEGNTYSKVRQVSIYIMHIYIIYIMHRLIVLEYILYNYI